MRVAVVGAGIFGITIALQFSKKGHDVILFEKEKDIMTKVSVKNHFRHHYGYHYPRSKTTALESIHGRKSFEKEYSDCILPYFPTYYSIVKKEEGTLTTPEEYLKFCDDIGLTYKVIETPELINKDRMAMTIEVPERAFDPIKLKDICRDKLINSKVILRTGSEIVGGNIRELTISEEGKEYTDDFDCIVNATYANMNKVKKILNIPRDVRQYELLELIKVKIPGELFGAMNMDGEFTSVIPMGSEGDYTIAHAKGSVLKTVVTDDFDDSIESFGKFESNRENIMEVAIKDFPILKDSEFIESVFVTKVVKANVDETDERPSEIFNHGNNVYSVFAGKIVTVVDIANKLLEMAEDKKC